MKEFFKAIGEFFGWKKQADDPETIRLKKIREIDNEIKEEVQNIKRLSTQRVTLENETEMAIAIGAASLHIVELRAERRSYER